MSISPVEQSIRDFIAKNLLYSRDTLALPSDTSLLKEGIIDSLGVVELVEFVQTRFCVQVTQQEVTPAHFDSIAKLTAFVHQKIGNENTVLPSACDH